MKVVNRTALEAYETERERLLAHHKQQLADLDATKPVEIELKKNEGNKARMIGNGFLVPPGVLFGKDEKGNPLALMPENVGPGQIWVEVK